MKEDKSIIHFLGISTTLSAFAIVVGLLWHLFVVPEEISDFDKENLKSKVKSALNDEDMKDFLRLYDEYNNDGKITLVEYNNLLALYRKLASQAYTHSK